MLHGVSHIGSLNQMLNNNGGFAVYSFQGSSWAFHIRNTLAKTGSPLKGLRMKGNVPSRLSLFTEFLVRDISGDNGIDDELEVRHERRYEKKISDMSTLLLSFVLVHSLPVGSASSRLYWCRCRFEGLHILKT